MHTFSMVQSVYGHMIALDKLKRQCTVHAGIAKVGYHGYSKACLQINVSHVNLVLRGGGL